MRPTIPVPTTGRLGTTEAGARCFVGMATARDLRLRNGGQALAVQVTLCERWNKTGTSVKATSTYSPCVHPGAAPQSIVKTGKSETFRNAPGIRALSPEGATSTRGACDEQAS